MSVEAFRSRIGSALANRDYAEVEAAWREYASLHPEDHEYLIEVAGQLARYDKGAVAGELCLTLAQALLEKGDPAGALAAAKASLRASQRTEGLRDLLKLAYATAYAENPHIEEFLGKAGLDDEGGNLRTQVERLDEYLTFEQGAYVFHRGGWGYGEVVDFDAEEEHLTVDFQRKRGHRIGIKSANKILERLDRDHFGVYKHYRRDELDALMKDDPAKVFHIFLQSHGGEATLKQVREEFVPDILDKQAWTRWWGRAKKALLKDPAIRIGKGSSPLLQVRDKAKPIEQEVADRMREKESGTARSAVAREYLRTLDLTPQLAAAIGEVVDESLAQEEGATPSRLALLYLKADLKGEEAEEAAEEARRMAAEAEDVVALTAPLEPMDRKRVVQALAESGVPDWAERLTALLRAGDTEVADTILEHLRKTRPDILIGFFAELTANPRANPNLFLWYVRGFLQGTIPVELAPGEKETTAMDKLLTLANQTGLEQKRGGDPTLKEFLRQLRTFLTARKLKTFRAFVDGCTLDYARYLYAKIQRNRGFTDQSKQALLDVLEAEHPDIHAQPEAEESEHVTPSSDVIWTTLAGYHRKENELRHILEVEVPKNAEDLGRAASHGDISENAEYSAALEKQDQIMRKVRELRESLDRARILEPDDVTTERVVVGTRVHLRNKSRDKKETFSILGPWDVDLSRGFISYLSPVGRGLLGKQPGRHVEIERPEQGRVDYEILSIEPEPSLLEEEETN